MHPRNKYINEPKFAKLAQEYTSFRPFVTIDNYGRGHLDFKDPLAVKELTKVLLKKDFKLDVEFPDDSLCPAVPNRLNYVLWLEDLLDDTLSFEAEKNIIGIDIGVGASCIYPLLACSNNPSWKFIGTDIDERSVEIATKNVSRNNLSERIQIKYNPDPNKMFLLDDDTKYTFSMSNPPFYSSQEEVQEGLANKELEPSQVCTGTNNEMITEGGELAFIGKMVQESLKLKHRVVWYSSMIGFKKTIRPLICQLVNGGVTNYVVTQFTQGRTSRWAIAWSFFAERPKTAKVIDTWTPKNQLEAQLPTSVNELLVATKEILDDLDIKYDVSQEEAVSVLDCSVDKNTWSRAARRQKKRQKLDTTESASDNPFIFKLELSPNDQKCNLQIAWHTGGDRSMFESFWNHFSKRAEESCGIYKGSTYNKVLL